MIATETMAAPPTRRDDPTGVVRRLSFHAMGTACSVQYVAPHGDVQAHGFERAVLAWTMAFEAKYSRYRPDSIVSRINQAAGREWVAVDQDTEQLLALCDTLVAMTRGVLDPTALPLMRLWDYKAPQPKVPSDAAIADARALVGWHKVQRAPGRVFLPEAGMALDFGGFGKEYAVDMVAQLAVARGIAAALVDFGHDLKAIGTPPGRIAWHVGLENPRLPGAIDGSIGVTNRGVASSGDYLRCFEIGGKRYGHIIDPRTGWPVANGCQQVTIVAPSCLQAGVLSTTAFVLGLRDGIDFIQSCPGAEGLIVTEHARAQTRGFFNYVAT